MKLSAKGLLAKRLSAEGEGPCFTVRRRSIRDLRNGGRYAVMMHPLAPESRNECEQECLIVDKRGRQVLGGTLRLQAEWLPAGPYRRGQADVSAPEGNFTVYRATRTRFDLYRNGRGIGTVNCGSGVHEKDFVEAEFPPLTLAALYSLCARFTGEDGMNMV